MMLARLTVLALIAAAVPAGAQYRGPDPKVSIERIKVLDRMVGTWQAKGWIDQSGRESFISTETVARELDGTLLTIRGLHRDAANTQRIVHNTLGIISWDQAAQRYGFRAYLATGQNSDFTLTATDTGFAWTMDAGPARIRYNATVTATSWIEDGERSLNGGKSWTPFFHMELAKTK